MDKTLTFWLPILFALTLAGVGLLSRNQGWGWSGWLTAATIIIPIAGSMIWAFLRKNPEEATENNRP